MKFIVPRVIFGNRGDLGSRWGVLAALKDLGLENVVVFRKYPEDVPNFGFTSLPYGKARNLVLPPGYWKYFKNSNVILWAVGLDLQDEFEPGKAFLPLGNIQPLQVSWNEDILPLPGSRTFENQTRTLAGSQSTFSG